MSVSLQGVPLPVMAPQVMPCIPLGDTDNRAPAITEKPVMFKNSAPPPGPEFLSESDSTWKSLPLTITIPTCVHLLGYLYFAEFERSKSVFHLLYTKGLPYAQKCSRNPLKSYKIVQTKSLTVKLVHYSGPD